MSRMTFHCVRACAAGALGLTAIWSVATGIAQEPSVRTLHALTVPAARLPDGCRPPQPPEGRRIVDPVRRTLTVSMGGNSGLPGVTTDRAAVAAIRARIDPAPRLPDAPPDRAESVRISQRWVEHVIDGYRASYVMEDESHVDVFAIRFDDAARVLPSLTGGNFSRAPRVASRIVRGPIVAVVSATARTPCFEAVDGYIRSLR